MRMLKSNQIKSHPFQVFDQNLQKSYLDLLISDLWLMSRLRFSVYFLTIFVGTIDQDRWVGYGSKK